MKVFFDAYKVSPNSSLGKARCLSCHQAPAPPKLNPFGQDVFAAMRKLNARMLTPEILKSVEKKDSDGDGVNNGKEIRKGSLPSDKSSKPALALALAPIGLLCFRRRGATAP